MQVSDLTMGVLTRVVVVVGSVPDYFWSRVTPLFQLSFEFPLRAVSTVSFTPILLGLKCMLRVCMYRKGAIEWEKRGVGNISFRWWRKPERTTGQPQVTDNLLTYG